MGLRINNTNRNKISDQLFKHYRRPKLSLFNSLSLPPLLPHIHTHGKLPDFNSQDKQL